MSNPYKVSIGDIFFHFSKLLCEFFKLKKCYFGYHKGNAFIYFDSQRRKDDVSSPFVNLNMLTATKFCSSQNNHDVT